MQKQDEISKPNSCLNKAKDDEMLFVLLQRDKAAEATIRFWISERIRLGLNSQWDVQITEALNCADKMNSGYKIEKEKVK